MEVQYKKYYVKFSDVGDSLREEHDEAQTIEIQRANNQEGHKDIGNSQNINTRAHERTYRLLCRCLFSLVGRAPAQ